MDEENVVYSHIHTQESQEYLVIKKNKILPFVTTWMDLRALY